METDHARTDGPDAGLDLCARNRAVVADYMTRKGENRLTRYLLFTEDGSAGLYRPHRACEIVILAGQGAQIGQVNVAAKDQVGAGCRPATDSGSMPAHDVGFVFGADHAYRLVGDDDAELLGICLFEARRDFCPLRCGNGSVGMAVIARGVDAQHQYIVACAYRRQIASESPCVVGIRPQQARRCIEKRDVVIARNGQ